MEANLLGWALAVYLVFAILHAVFPVALERLRPASRPVWPAHLFAPLALVLVLLPIFKLDTLSLALWPVVLLVALLAIGLASVTLSLLAIVALLVLTGLATASWILRVPETLTALPDTLWIISGFAGFFFVAGQVVGCRIVGRLKTSAAGSGGLPTAGPWPSSVTPVDGSVTRAFSGETLPGIG